MCRQPYLCADNRICAGSPILQAIPLCKQTLMFKQQRLGFCMMFGYCDHQHIHLADSQSVLQLAASLSLFVPNGFACRVGLPAHMHLLAHRSIGLPAHVVDCIYIWASMP